MRKFVDLAHISERRLCKAGTEVAIASPQRPPTAPVAPALIPGAAPAAPAPSPPSPITQPSSVLTQPTGGATNVAVAAPTTPPASTPVVAPVVPPDVTDIGRKLQKELVRVGCGVGGLEADGTWNAASREALRSFNERTRSLTMVDQPTPEALEAVRSHKDRVCPTTCGPGTELRGNTCVAVPPKTQERSRHASRPPEREHDRAVRPQREPGRADPAPRPSGSQSYANVPISPNNRNGESWIYVGNKRCKTFEPPGSAPRVICP